MDNITHSLVGAAVGQTGLKRLSGLGMATLIISANIPDVDVLAILFGDQLTFRRGWTHGPIGLVVLPVLVTGVMILFDAWQARRGKRPASRLPVRPWQLLLLAYIGALTHPFLDWLNNYGVRLLMPFSHEWYFGDAIFIIDPWIWLALGVTIFISRRLSRRGFERPGLPAIVGLLLVATYIGLMIGGSRVASHSATRMVEERGLGPVERMMAGPLMVNPFQREIIFDRGGSYGTGLYRFMPSPDLEILHEYIPSNMTDPRVQRAMDDPGIASFLYWSRFPFFVVEERQDSALVHVGDLRYMMRPGSGWGSRTAVVEP